MGVRNNQQLSFSVFVVNYSVITDFQNVLNEICSALGQKNMSVNNEDVLDLMDLCDGEIAYIDSFLLPYVKSIESNGMNVNYGQNNSNIEYIIKMLKVQKGKQTFLEWFKTVIIE